MIELPITKYHGCGNDFLIVHAAAVADLELEPLIVAACDRNSGIGADGFIVVEPEPLEMRFYNADGSAAPMCGNGIRCFAKFCADEDLTGQEVFPVRTGAGVKTVRIISREPFEARIDLGRPDYDRAAIGVPEGKTWGRELEILGRTVRLYSFFMCTVHTVCFVEDVAEDGVLTVAEAIHRHPIFTRKTNVNMVQIVDRNTLKMRTWERGVGPTLACGTGAGASVVTARRLGLCDAEADVLLPKGKLHISVGENERTALTGPAERILKGVYEWRPE